jgi:hypothetical protein
VFCLRASTRSSAAARLLVSSGAVTSSARPDSQVWPPSDPLRCRRGSSRHPEVLRAIARSSDWTSAQPDQPSDGSRPASLAGRGAREASSRREVGRLSLSERRDERLTVEVLGGDSTPIRAGAKLAQHDADDRMHTADQRRLRRQGELAELVPGLSFALLIARPALTAAPVALAR